MADASGVETAVKSEMKPPVASVGVVGWIRANLFNSWYNSVFTILTLLLIYKTFWPFVKWAFIDSLWFSTGQECQAGDGACWSVITANIRFILFGFYPYEQHWRPGLAIALLVGLLLLSQYRRFWKKSLAVYWVIGLVVMGILLRGGILGLSSVEVSKWGGLPLTLLLSVFGLTAAYPLGIMLALGRQSKMPTIKSLCVIYIELIRGVPLISLLFMSSVVFPLFLPEGVTIPGLLRAQVAIILFTAAYIAEVVRGGLQGMSKGQYEAADSLGLNYYQTMRLIILPQALKIVIPPSVSILISAFKDTSLVVIIALYDLLKTTQSTLQDPRWMGFSAEAYIFIALIYFICCFYLSNFSRKIERELDTGY
ncbi:MAG: amino acid ABC transporter permease [Desulfobacteraceae bacterium]|jgi:general L-amino acid transport system permease protein